MKLKSIKIEAAETWQDWTGYRGEVVFESDNGKVQINTGEALSQRILEVCADQIVATSKQVATQLTAEVIEQSGGVPAIETESKEN